MAVGVLSRLLLCVCTLIRQVSQILTTQLTVFYTGEAIHRDREVRIEPVLWAAPAPHNVFLLSKFLAVLSAAVSLIVLIGLAAMTNQLLRGHSPVDLSAYLIA